MQSLSSSSTPTVRPARSSDVQNIFHLIDSMTGDGTLLRRSATEIEQQIESFLVADSAEGDFLGCAALHRYNAQLAEIRSIAVRPEARGLGAGGMLLQHLLADLQESGTGCACLFTRIPEFFAHYGFHTVPAGAVIAKVAKDCVRCPRRQACDETAMALGELPPYPVTVLPAAVQHALVQLSSQHQ